MHVTGSTSKINAVGKPAASSFQTIDLLEAQRNLIHLFDRVREQKGRIEINGDNGVCGCVLISKEELDTLEHALEVLADSENFKAIQQSLTTVAAALHPLSVNSA